MRSLSDGSAYFAAPATLNDTLEAKFDLADADSFSTALQGALAELANQRGLSIQYRPDLATMEAFANGHRAENERFQASCQQVGIFSTARRPDNQPMWAYYCDNSRGVCFELEWSKKVMEGTQLWPADVAYTTKARVHNRADDLARLLVDLGQQHPDWTVEQVQEHSLSEKFRRRWGVESVARAVSMKHADWQHENEIRFISPRAGPLPLMQDILKRVFFVRTDFAEWGPIMMLLHRLYPSVELCQLSFHHDEPYVGATAMKRKLVPLSQNSLM